MGSMLQLYAVSLQIATNSCNIVFHRRAKRCLVTCWTTRVFLSVSLYH